MSFHILKIRITQQQWPKILEFQQEAKEQQHHDLDFIFHKMLLEKAFVFVASEDDVCISLNFFEYQTISSVITILY